VKLVEHLSLQTPLLWVTTEEPARVIDVLAKAEKSRDLFRLDMLQGLIVWSNERSRWLKVLTDAEIDGQMVQVPITNMQESFDHVLSKRGIMIIANAHAVAEQMSDVFVSLIVQYREAFYQDDNDKMPLQLIMLSHEDEVPRDINRMATHVIHELPDDEELTNIFNHFHNESNSRLMDRQRDKIVRAGLGLSETEFISASLLSIRENNYIKPEYVNKHKIELLKNNGILEVRTPDLTIDDLGGMDNAKTLIRQISKLWNNPAKAESRKIVVPRRVMMVGVPGSGKSLFCEAVSNQLCLDLAKGGVSQAMNKFIGESESNMRRMFATLKRMAPIVFWVDEFGRDMSGGQSSGSTDGGTTDRVHGEFLTGLQELPDNIFMTAAANRIEELPPEITRAGRFDRVMFVGLPTEQEREEIFRIHLGEVHYEYNVNELARATQFFTGAEIKSLIEEVRFEVDSEYDRSPTTKEIVSYAPRVKGLVWNNHRDSIVAMYRRALVEWDWASSSQQAEAQFVIASATGNQNVPQYQGTKKQAPAGKTVKWGS